MRRNRWFLLVAALVAILALTAAGCGGDDGGDEGAQGDTAIDTGTGPDAGGAPAPNQEITIAWGAEPPSLDPGLATDTTSANVIFNLMDPLVKLDENLEPEPNLAESWDVEGNVVTYHLRDDGRWTNGDPVTAGDFEYSWKRTLSPELAADYAYQLYGIEGAAEYNGCEKNCNALRDKVGVKAIDDQTLQVTLTSEQPWFIAQSAHHSFLAVHQETVEQFKDKWTDPENIVTNGPFKLVERKPEQTINLEKNEEWRNADEVMLERVNGRIIVDGTTRVQAFEAGEVTVLDGAGLPPEEMERLKEMEEYEQYPALGTYYYGFNIKNVSDVNQRRAMSLAINRRELIDNVALADQIPATGFTPQGTPGFDVLNPASPWLPEEGDMDQAKELMDQVASPKTKINLFHNDSPGHREIAVAVQGYWEELGIDTTIKAQEWAQYLENLGPPPAKVVDVYRLGWIGDFPDAINFLELWTCKSGNNNTNFCNKEYDAAVERAKNTPEEDARFQIYGELEEMLLGADGEVPIAPIYYYTYPNLEHLSVKETFHINLLDQFDLSEVVVEEVEE